MHRSIVISLLVICFGCKKPNSKVEKLANNDKPTTTGSKITNEEKVSLIGEWEFENVPNDDKKAKIRFISETKLIGNDGCNQFFGHYSVAGNSLRFQAISSTKKFCPEVKSAIIANMDLVTSFEIEEKKLLLTDGVTTLLLLRRINDE